MIVSIDHIQLMIPTSQEEKARAFYVQVLGFEEIPKPTSGHRAGGAWFRCGEVELHLGADSAFQPSRRAHPAFVATEFDALCNRLVEAGYDIERAASYDGRNRAFIFDPFGNRLELLEHID